MQLQNNIADVSYNNNADAGSTAQQDKKWCQVRSEGISGW